MTDHMIAITSSSFCKNQTLIEEARRVFKEVRLNLSDGRLKKEELIDFLYGCDGAIIGLETVDEDVLKKCPQLKAISKYGVGIDNIDLNLLKKHNVSFLFTPGVNKRSVAELTLGLIIGLLRKIPTYNDHMKSNIWRRTGGEELTGTTVGIIGCGNIGKELIHLLQPFCCNILINDILNMDEFCKCAGVKQVTKQEIISKSDIISLHIPLTDLTRYMFCHEEFKNMKRSAYLINTSRGGVVCEKELVYALNEKLIAGAACDVYENEPEIHHALVTHKNFIATPHIAGNSSQGVLAMGRAAIENLQLICV